MRIWKNGKGDLLTDEQVLRQVAIYGDLASAADADNIRLLVPGREHPVGSHPRQGRRLRDYLEEA